MSIATLLLYVQDYINSEISLEMLEEWIAPRLPAIYDSRSSIATKIVSEIELALIEIEEGRMTEDELKSSLTQYFFFCSKHIGSLNIKEDTSGSLFSLGEIRKSNSEDVIFDYDNNTDPDLLLI